MIDSEGEKYILVHSSIYDKDKVTFRSVKTQAHYSEYDSVSEAIDACLNENPNTKFFVFDDGIEMAKWILE